MNAIAKVLGKIRIPAPVSRDPLDPEPEPWLMPFYAVFEHAGEEFVVIDTQVADCGQVEDGRFGYTIVHRRTGMGARIVCDMTVEEAARHGAQVCAANWGPKVEMALKRWPILNP